MKIFIEIHGDNHLNMIVNEVKGRVEGMKSKNQKQSDIRDFLKQYCANVALLIVLLEK